MKFKFALGYRDLGDTIDFLLRAKRDGVAGKAFLKKTIKNNERPEKVTLDKSESNKCALDYFNKGISTEDKIEMFAEAVMGRFEILENKMDGFNKRLVFVERKLNISAWLRIWFRLR